MNNRDRIVKEAKELLESAEEQIKLTQKIRSTDAINIMERKKQENAKHLKNFESHFGEAVSKLKSVGLDLEAKKMISNASKYCGYALYNHGLLRESNAHFEQAIAFILSNKQNGSSDADLRNIVIFAYNIAETTTGLNEDGTPALKYSKDALLAIVDKTDKEKEIVEALKKGDDSKFKEYYNEKTCHPDYQKTESFFTNQILLEQGQAQAQFTDHVTHLHLKSEAEKMDEDLIETINTCSIQPQSINLGSFPTNNDQRKIDEEHRQTANNLFSFLALKKIPALIAYKENPAPKIKECITLFERGITALSAIAIKEVDDQNKLTEFTQAKQFWQDNLMRSQSNDSFEKANKKLAGITEKNPHLIQLSKADVNILKDCRDILADSKDLLELIKARSDEDQRRLNDISNNLVALKQAISDNSFKFKDSKVSHFKNNPPPVTDQNLGLDDEFCFEGQRMQF